MRRGWILALAFLFACGRQSEEEKLIEAVSPVKSWAASLAYAGELWMKNRVPKSLLVNGVKSAGKEIEKARKQLGKSKAADDTKQAVGKALDELADSARALDAAVRNHDVKIAEREIARCKEVYARLDALEKP